MQITNTTTVGEAAPFINEEHLKELLESELITALPLEKSVFAMTLGEFLECFADDYATRFFSNPDTILIFAVGRLKQWRSEMESVSKILTLNELKLTNEEKAAQRGVVFPTAQESILCEAVEYFHLHSFDEAEQIPLSNYLIMKRKKSAEALYQRNLNKIYAAKNEKAGKTK